MSMDPNSIRSVAAHRDGLETRYAGLVARMVDAFARAVLDDAASAFAAPVMLAAGRVADPFSFTQVMKRWYSAVRTLAADVGQDEFEIIEVLRQSDLPARAFEEVRDILTLARQEGWTEYRTKRHLSATLIPKDTGKNADKYPTRAAYRSEVRRIARTLATREAALDTEAELKRGGYPSKRWVTQSDDRVRGAHHLAHGQEVGLNESFKVGGEILAFPGDPRGRPDNIYNCRCVMVGGEIREDEVDLMALLASADGGTALMWSGVIGMEQRMTGDGRLINEGALTWDLPVPLRYAPEDIGGHGGAQVVGTIHYIERRPGGEVFGAGTFDLGSEIGREAARQVQEGITRGISMDLDSVAFEVRVAREVLERHEAVLDGDGDGARKIAEDGSVVMAEVGAEDEIHVTTSARIRAATVVAIPAFAEAMISTDDEDDEGPSEDEAIASATEEIINDEGSAVASPGMASETEEFNWVEDTGGLPQYIRRIADNLIERGMSESRAIASAVNTVKRWAKGGTVRANGGPRVSAKTAAKAAAAVAEWMSKRARARASAGEAEEFVSLVAAGGPMKPDPSWFEDPELTEPTALTVQKDGRVFGHLATWDSCHIGSPDYCTSPPNSATGYAYFHTGSILLADDSEQAVGHLTLGTGHARADAKPLAAMNHYDNTGTVAADVRVGEDSWGIWVAGALRPGLTDKQVRELRAAPLSGDWRRIQGNLELVAALAVNVPGFPIPRPHGLTASGETVALVASGMIPPKKVKRPGTEGALSESDLRYLRGLAQRERANQARRLAAEVLAEDVHDFARTMNLDSNDTEEK